MTRVQYLITIDHDGKCPKDMGEVLADRAHMYLHAKGGMGEAMATLMEGPAMIVLDVKEMRDE